MPSTIATRAPLIALALLAAPLAAQQQPVRRTLAGTDVAVWNVAGRVRVEAGTGADVVVTAELLGRDAGRLRVETGEIRGANTLRVVYPAERIRYDEMGRGSRTTLRIRDDGTFGGGGRDGGDGGDRVEVSGREGLDAHANLVIHVPPGKRLRVYQAVGDVNVTGTDGELLVDVSAATVTATRTKGSLRVDTGSGEVRVSDAEGDVDLDTGSGEVQVARVKGGVLRIDTGSGGVRGDGIEVTRLDVDVGSGGIELTGVRAHDVRLDNGSGSVDVALTATVRSMVIDTGSGGVTLRVPESLGAELEIESGSGGIDADVPVTVRRQSRDHLSARIGEGGGRIKIDTGSGGVRIVRAR